jgi:hypothetical protein
VSCPPHDRRADAPQPYLPEVRPPPAPHAERVDERHAP